MRPNSKKTRKEEGVGSCKRKGVKEMGREEKREREEKRDRAEEMKGKKEEKWEGTVDCEK